MLRALPNMTLCAPADPVEAKAAAQFMATHRGPGYVRLNKSGEPAIHDPSLPLKIQPGTFLEITQGHGTAILVTGAMLSQVLDEIRQAGKAWAVYSVPFVGAYDAQSLRDLASRYSTIVTVEEHQLNGGFGSSIVEQISDLFGSGAIPGMPRVQRVGVPNTFIGVSGSQHYLRQLAGLTLTEIFKTVS
jgi:transketolase